MKRLSLSLLLSALLLFNGCGASSDGVQAEDGIAAQDIEAPWFEEPQARGVTDGASSTGCASDQAEEAFTQTADQAESPSLEQLRACIAGSYYACAVAYLGQVEQATPEGIRSLLETSSQLEQFPFLQDIPETQMVLYAGTELYCVVPQSAVTSVTLRALDFSVDGVAKAGQTLYSGSGDQAVLLLCNQDGAANVRLTISGAGGQLEYSPSLTGGVLNVPVTDTGVYDFSVYQEALSLELDQGLLGVWTLKEEGLSCTLSIERDGSVVLEQNQETYQGTLTPRLEDSMGGYIAALDLMAQTEEAAAWLHCVYRLQEEDGLLILSYIQGDALYPDAPSSFLLLKN